MRVAQEIDAVLQQESHAVSALASMLRVRLDEIKKAAKLAAVLHDLGKLNKEWQGRAGIPNSADPADLLAHTGGRNYITFPPHATVSAYALWPALVDRRAPASSCKSCLLCHRPSPFCKGKGGAGI
jgi:CRISPR/Cas system-associated endonuclease Cas3-HD